MIKLTHSLLLAINFDKYSIFHIIPLFRLTSLFFPEHNHDTFFWIPAYSDFLGTSLV